MFYMHAVNGHFRSNINVFLRALSVYVLYDRESFSGILLCIKVFDSSSHIGYSYFQVGSTEWVEQNIVNLGAKAVAYLNVDCAVQGPGFFAGSTPQLDDLLIEVTKNVSKIRDEVMIISVYFVFSPYYELV